VTLTAGPIYISRIQQPPAVFDGSAGFKIALAKRQHPKVLFVLAGNAGKHLIRYTPNVD